MASYSVIFKPSAEKDLRGLPGSIVARIVKQVEGLKSNPLPRQSVKLSGAAELYRMRIGDYLWYTASIERPAKYWFITSGIGEMSIADSKPLPRTSETVLQRRHG